MEGQKEWYVLHTYSGYENKVRENINLRKESLKMEDNIFRIVIPEEEIIEIVDGEEKKKVAKTFPGYVLIEMIMSDEAWFIVRNTPGVTGFVGSHGAGSKPSPLLPEEINTILGEVESIPQKIELNVQEGDLVEITQGAFAGFMGTVGVIDKENQILQVTIEMFGRETDAELEFSQVKKKDL